MVPSGASTTPYVYKMLGPSFMQLALLNVKQPQGADGLAG
jgi:hypothetical protein